MNLKQILQNPPDAHKNSNGQYYSMGIPEKVLSFVSDHIDQTSNTLETGCGLSTVIFALAQSHHACITPARHEIERVKDYCRQNGIAAQKVKFYCDVSENVLPTLECEPLDLVLIDGRHGFPAPFIDFYYAGGKLKVNGLLVIDDTWLWTGDVLKQHLLLEPEWKLEADFSPRTCVFRKLAEGSQSKEWTEQEFVVRNSRFKLNDKPPSYLVTTFRYIKRGEFSLLAKKIGRKLTSRNSDSVANP
jgi:hypothetical protein